MLTNIQSDLNESRILSDDEGSSTNYFVQRFMERSTSNMQNHAFSPEQIDNAINMERECEAYRKITLSTRSSKFAEEEFVQNKLPLKTKSATPRTNLSLTFASPSVVLQKDNFKPTDYTYARSCTYRRSSPSDKNLKSPVLRRKGLYCKSQDDNYSYQANLNEETDYLYHNTRDFTTTQRIRSTSWYFRLWQWLTNRTDKFRFHSNVNGIPPQMRSASVLFSGKSKTMTSSPPSSPPTAPHVSVNKNGKHSLLETKTVDLVEKEIALKEIRKVVTEETIIDEIAKEEETKPKRSLAFLWPCFLCLLLPLLFLVPALLLASRCDSNNSTLYNYTRHILQLTNVKNFYTFQTPSTVPLPPVEIIKYVTDPELVKKFELQLLTMQNRIAALEGANAGSVVDLEKFQKRLNDINADNNALTLLVNEIRLHVNQIGDFRDKLLKLESDGDERKVWQTKLMALIGDYDKRNDELNLLKDKIDSLVNATCNCSSLLLTTTGGTIGLNLEDINAIIAAAIAKYDADKTGLADYALEPAGGSVISIRCTETFYPYTRRISWWSLPFGYQDYSPRTVIQPGLSPGECWAFKGGRGYLVIQLSHVIRVTAVSYEHIPRSISPDGRIDSAPKQMEVYGLRKEIDPEPVLLGAFTYDDQKEPLQYFPIQNENPPIVPMIELRILTNHGHPVYTCMYRFRVHGQLVQPNS